MVSDSAKQSFTITDLAYGHHREPPLLARLYRPIGAGPFPAVVDIHGGAWTSNDRTQNAFIAQWLAARGVLVVSVDFRMPPEARFPAAVNDVNHAIRWVKQEAEQLGTLPQLVGALGTSSGGHLLLLNALQPDNEVWKSRSAPTAHVDGSLAFAIACWAVIDPFARYLMAREVDRQELIVAHHAFWKDADEMAFANPQRIVESGEAVRLPPLLIVEAGEDRSLPPDTGKRFAAAYKSRGGLVERALFRGQPHRFISADPSSSAAIRALRRIRRFIGMQFRPADLQPAAGDATDAPSLA